MKQVDCRVFVYWMPQCQTSQRAVDLMQRMGVTITGFRDLKNDRLSDIEIRMLCRMAGGPEKIFSRRAIKYRVLELYKVELTGEDMISYMTGEPTFIRRPVVVTEDGDVLAGLNLRQLQQYFSEYNKPEQPRVVLHPPFPAVHAS